MVSRNVCDALVSTPPAAVPPSSTARTVTIAAPCTPGAPSNVSVPSAATAGCPAGVKSVVSLLETANETTWPASSAGPLVIAVAHPGTLWGPAFSSTD